MQRSGSIRILYIEDDQGLARLFQKRLERAGYEVLGGSGDGLHRQCLLEPCRCSVRG